MAAVAGVRSVTIGSQTLAVGDSLDVPISDVTREVVTGLTGPSGYTETPATAYVEFEAVLTASVDLAALVEPGQTVQVDFRSGRSYVFDDAVLAGEPPSYSGSTGKVTLRFEGATGSGRWI